MRPTQWSMAVVVDEAGVAGGEEAVGVEDLLGGDLQVALHEGGPLDPDLARACPRAGARPSRASTMRTTLPGRIGTFVARRARAAGVSAGRELMMVKVSVRP